MTQRIIGRRTAGKVLAAGLMAPAIARAQATELTFWTWRQEDRTQYGQLFQDFTRANANIRIRFEAFEPQNYGTVLSTALAAGRGPDVIHIRAYGGTEQFARANYLLPLTREAVPELANFEADALRSVSLRADSQVYAVPFASQTLGLFTNRDIFARLNLQVPETWDQLLATARTARERNMIPLANGLATAFMVEVFASVFMPAFYGTAFTDDVVAGRATFEDPRYVGALAKLLELREFMPQGFAGVDYPTMQQLFVAGRAAMFAGGSFEIANFRRQNPNLPMEFHAPPAAQAGGPRLVSLFYDGGYAVNARTEKRDAALRLVRFMATPEFGNKFSSLLGNISPIRGVQITDPLLARVAQLNASSVPYLMAVHFRFQDPTGSTLLQAAIQRMMAGQATPAEVGAEITRGIATYHTPFQRR
jgi:raffinose/stachyose/melibiose transport system substrate-binding protein